MSSLSSSKINSTRKCLMVSYCFGFLRSCWVTNWWTRCLQSQLCMEKCRVYQERNLYFFKTLCGWVSDCIIPVLHKGGGGCQGLLSGALFSPEKTPIRIFYKSEIYKRWTFCHTLTSNTGKKCWHLLSVLRKHHMGTIQLVVPYGLGNIGGTSSFTPP